MVVLCSVSLHGITIPIAKLGQSTVKFTRTRSLGRRSGITGITTPTGLPSGRTSPTPPNGPPIAVTSDPSGAAFQPPSGVEPHAPVDKSHGHVGFQVGVP